MSRQLIFRWYLMGYLVISWLMLASSNLILT
nr:MAG TPA: hypothetical protein [Bacteriophage sp.]